MVISPIAGWSNELVTTLGLLQLITILDAAPPTEEILMRSRSQTLKGRAEVTHVRQ